MNAKFILGGLLFIAQNNYAAINKNSELKLQAPSITIAIIDTGVDIEHKDLKKFIWTNPGETGLDKNGRDKATNGLDDDGNGFADDVHGWNFVKNNNDVSDDNGHGTHIAGIIRKEFQKHHTDSTSPRAARFMILKYYNEKAANIENVINTAKAIEYANHMQANIINYSGGGASEYPKEFEAIKNAGKKNILFVAAAGNNNENTDNLKYYPANYPLKNIISVAATDNEGELVSFSNYGKNSVDIAAPGQLIYSTLPNNTYGVMSGTSQATAFVTGIAASLMAKYGKGQKSQDLLQDLLASSQYNKSLKGKTKFQLAVLN
jgi:subtilisin family serine protease